jgi:hypothetical protein
MTTTEVCRDSRGNTLFVEETEQGRCYWSDEVGGGVMVWHTALVSSEMLELALNAEDKATVQSSERPAKRSFHADECN